MGGAVAVALHGLSGRIARPLARGRPRLDRLVSRADPAGCRVASGIGRWSNPFKYARVYAALRTNSARAHTHSVQAEGE
eukprot:9622371-Alexandrium_andersonii.AAC.1